MLPELGQGLVDEPVRPLPCRLHGAMGEVGSARSTMSARFLETPKRPKHGPGKKPEASNGAWENMEEKGPEPLTAHAPARPRMHSSSPG